MNEKAGCFYSRIFTPERTQIVKYLVSGVLTTVTNILLFNFFLFLRLDYRIANLIALVSVKLFAFVMNKFFVFRSKVTNLKALFKDFAGFFSGRIFTGLIDYFGLILLVEVFFLPQKGSKYALQVVVIVLNYIFAKLVFQKKPVPEENK
jgi:putative flippase GtrA